MHRWSEQNKAARCERSQRKGLTPVGDKSHSGMERILRGKPLKLALTSAKPLRTNVFSLYWYALQVKQIHHELILCDEMYCRF